MHITLVTENVRRGSVLPFVLATPSSAPEARAYAVCPLTQVPPLPSNVVAPLADRDQLAIYVQFLNDVTMCIPRHHHAPPALPMASHTLRCMSRCGIRPSRLRRRYVAMFSMFCFHLLVRGRPRKRAIAAALKVLLDDYYGVAVPSIREHIMLRTFIVVAFV